MLYLCLYWIDIQSLYHFKLWLILSEVIEHVEYVTNKAKLHCARSYARMENRSRGHPVLRKQIGNWDLSTPNPPDEHGVIEQQSSEI